MVMEIKWCGFDFGQCLMEPAGLRNPILFGDIYKLIGRPEAIREKIKKYRILKEKYGDYGRIKEGHRDEIYSFVLDNNQEAIDLYLIKEQELLRTGGGLEEALEYLRAQGVSINVVSELKKTLGPMGSDIISRFLVNKGLIGYFEELVTPQGKICLSDGHTDISYQGLTKEEGTIYDKLAEDLKNRGIQPHEAVIVGDKPQTDIYPASKRGFRTIQYVGCVDYGPAEADYVISSFLQLREIIRGPK